MTSRSWTGAGISLAYRRSCRMIPTRQGWPRPSGGRERAVGLSSTRTWGSGIGGALVIDGDLFRGGCGIAAELGQVRPGLEAQQPSDTIESMASGWGITAQVRARLASRDFGTEDPRTAQLDASDLIRRAGGRPDRLNTKLIARAAEEGNHLAQGVFDRACRTFGWGIAQVVTLLSPNVVVIGGGVSLVGENLFLMPLRDYVNRYVFPPLAGTFEIRRASLGEEVVLHGVLALAATEYTAPGQVRHTED